jgi:hypothetical protein
MIKKILIIISIFTVVFSSCTRIVSIALGVRPPRVETIESIQSFCKRKGINTDEILIVKTNYIAKSLEKNLNEEYVFDRNGFQLKYNVGFADSTCGGNILKTIRSIQPVSYLERDSLNLFNDHKKTWMPLNDTLANINVDCNNADYTIVLYWNTFSGYPGHIRRIKDVKESTSLNTSSTIQIVMINQDIRKMNKEVIMVNGQRIN